jgi:hypothetical protein
VIWVCPNLLYEGGIPWIGDINQPAVMKILSSSSQSEILDQQLLKLKKLKRFVTDASLKNHVLLGH